MSRLSRDRAIGVGVSLGVLAAAVWLSIAVSASPRIQAMSVGAGFTAMCIAIVVVTGLRRGRRELFAPPVLLAAYLLLGIGVKGLLDLVAGTSKIQGLLDPTDTQFANLLTSVFLHSTLALVAFMLGDAFGRRRDSRSESCRVPFPPVREPGLRFALWVSIAMTALGITVLVAQLGMALFLDPSFVATTGTIGLFWLYPLMYASVGGWALVIVNRWAAGQRAGIAYLVGLIGTAALVYLLTSSKAVLILAMLYLMVGHHYAVRPAHLGKLVLAACGFIAMLPLLYLHRATGVSLALFRFLTPETASSGLTILVGRSYLADSFAAVLYHTPRIYPFRYGASWLELFYFWIPRGFWPDKPLSQSLTFGPSYLSSFPQTGDSFYSPTLMGDAYLNMGTVGVFAVFLLLGYGLRWSYNRLVGRLPRPEGIVLYSLLVYWIAICAEQSVAISLELAFSYFAPVALIAYLARKYPGGDSAPSSQAQY